MKPVSPEYPAPPKKKAGQVHSPAPDWVTDEIYKIEIVQFRDIRIMDQLQLEPGLYEPHPDYNVPVPRPDVDKPTIEDYLTPNAEFETRGRPARRKRLSPPGK